MNKPLTHADIGRLWDEVGGPKLTSEQWSAMHRFCPRLLKEAAPPPQAAPKAERGVHPLTTQEVQRIAETLGAHITGRCNYDCWPGMGYRRDAGGEYTIPVVPGIAYEFARAIERAHGIKDPAAKGGE